MNTLRAFLLRTQIGGITLALLCAYLIRDLIGILISPIFYFSFMDLHNAIYSQYMFEPTLSQKAILLGVARSLVHFLITLITTYLLARWLYGREMLTGLLSWRTSMFPDEAPASEPPK